MKCPICESEMQHEPLIDAIAKGLSSVFKYPDEGTPQWFFDENIKKSEYAVCLSCNFVMFPPKEN